MPPLDPSNKRFLATILGVVGAALSSKLGISEELALAILGLIAGYFTVSKSGEVLIAQAEAKGAAASAGVVTLEQANDVIAKALADLQAKNVPIVPPVAPVVVVPVKK
jgi:hypothetical protein